MDVVIMILMFILGGLIASSGFLIYLLIQTNKDIERLDINIEQIIRSV